MSVLHGLASGAEARFFFWTDRHEWNSCPSRAFAGWVHLVLQQNQEQIPRRAFGPVRNDKGLFWWLYVALKRPLFHGGAGGGGDFGGDQAKSRARSRSKAADKSVRSTRYSANHRIRGGNASSGRRLRAGIRDPSTAHDVHFVDAMLRSG